jgi:two-component system OmpR family response regulator
MPDATNYSAEQPVTILLLEDDADLRETLTDGLSGAGYHVFPVSSVSEAYNHALLDQTHIAVLDLVLEHGQSTPVLMYIQRHPTYRHIKTIVMSGYDYAPRSADIFGADRFLKKPFKVAALIAMIQELQGAFVSAGKT